MSVKSKSGVSDHAEISETNWLALAIAFAMVTVVVVIWAGIHIFLVLDEPILRSQFSRTISPFLAFFAAGVTFFTVAWRGSISARQADETRRQNDAAEKAELALIFEKGFRYLGSGIDSDIAVGAALLNSILSAPKNEFKVQSMDAAVQAFKATLPKQAAGTTYFAHDDVMLLLKSGASLGVRSQKRIDVDAKRDGLTNAYFELGDWLPNGTYTGVEIHLGEAIRNNELENFRGYFRKCEFFSTIGEATFPEMKGGLLFRDCSFSDLSFSKIRLRKSLSFDGCNFSGADIFIPNTRFRPLAESFKGNEYNKENPPRFFVGYTETKEVSFAKEVLEMEFFLTATDPN